MFPLHTTTEVFELSQLIKFPSFTAPCFNALCGLLLVWTAFAIVALSGIQGQKNRFLLIKNHILYSYN